MTRTIHCVLTVRTRERGIDSQTTVRIRRDLPEGISTEDVLDQLRAVIDKTSPETVSEPVELPSGWMTRSKPTSEESVEYVR